MAAGYRVVHWWFGIYDGAFQAKTSQIAFEDYTTRAPTQSIVIDEGKIVLTWTHFTQTPLMKYGVVTPHTLNRETPLPFFWIR